ncbi:RNA-directed DNA polymerase [Paucisalibacillus sp. EB02]|uniref:RNA-directed DNA polymerase n=1 Tax=Paucisalibacillus sp. EB02 TaxID=1347087 RepID=UPI0004B12715|nr:RNA-directed DNA polymerase [Paucisalibacillus sp. EB02]
MSTVNARYEVIAPKIEYLKDEIILGQAWKKSHNYIRRHNWYADILELDCSIIDLEKKLKEYSTDLLERENYKPDPLRVVLAPKNQKWVFPEGADKLWYPKGKNDLKGEQALRPLAHMSIRDQTVNTAIMLCLADAIESNQGPTDEMDFLKAQREQIYSYGNRLQCEWISHSNKRKQAKFSWGSSKIYRQYFDDYKSFLKRPQDVCNYFAPILPTNKELYVLSLDLSKFYNHIDLNSLIEEIKYLYKEEYYKYYNLSEEFKDEPAFWHKVKEVFDWEWNKTDIEQNKEIIKSQRSSLGLPQGLVASGFFSNAYLIRFDRMVGEYLEDNQQEGSESFLSDNGIKLLDYCRYVDDIRLVVEASSGIDPFEIMDRVSNLIKYLLKKHLTEIKSDKEKIIDINESKSSIVSYHQLSNKSNISAVMNTIQHGISGTPDVDSLQQIVGELVGLLSISELKEEKDTKKGNALGLSRVFLPYMDIRDDTVKRFSATRLVKTLQLKKSMTVYSEKVAVSEVGSKSITAGQMLDHEFETVARKLISFWADNPSLSLLLKCGFDLYPDGKLLHPVLEALQLKIYDQSSTFDEIKTAEYVISDLLRAASISIGYKTGYDFPESVNLSSFRVELASFAKRLIDKGTQFPWYVRQQAALYLITNGDYGFSIEEDEKELRLYNLLYNAALYRKNKDVNIGNSLATSLIAQQLNPNKEKYATWLIDWMNDLDDDKSKKYIIQSLLLNRPDLLKKVLKVNKVKGSDWLDYLPKSIKSYLMINEDMDFNFNIKDPVPLIKVILSKNNPFKQENALLLLTQAILENPLTSEKLDKGSGIADIMVECKNWSEIQNPSFRGLEVRWSENKEQDIYNLYKSPTWIEGKYKWMYNLGAILRACITGDYDFTTSTFIQKEDIGVYKGLISTSYTRKFSLINHGRGLVEEPIPITPWLTELLYKFLRWPGIKYRDVNIVDWKDVSKVGDLRIIIGQRLHHQKDLYGKLTNTPVYTIPVSRNSKGDNSKIRFAVVQTLLPQVNDFNEKDPTNWDKLYRGRHRDHLASICHLISKQVKATAYARKPFDDIGDEDSFTGVDVIVFPELSINPDDIGILRGLSDETNAHIFAGLTFSKPTYSSKPINQGLWLLRSETSSGREFKYVYQGKQNMTIPEKKMGIEPYRPYQVIIELENNGKEPIRLAGAICYDATDLAVAADLRDVSDVFIISALNKDIQTFDNMVSYLHYHMYQPVILANTGEFGGSTVQAPFSKHQRTIAHVHGNQQIAISIFEIDPSLFKRRTLPKPPIEIKTPPAGYKGRY